MIMMGHDVVPHFHEDHHDLQEHSDNLPSSDEGLIDLQNTFSHFRHNTTEQSLVYVGSAEKTASPQKNNLYNTPFLPVKIYRSLGDANYKKQHFWEFIALSYSYKPAQFPLRGPPSC